MFDVNDSVENIYIELSEPRTPREVAEYLGISRSDVYRLIKYNTLKIYWTFETKVVLSESKNLDYLFRYFTKKAHTEGTEIYLKILHTLNEVRYYKLNL